jgi:hypothetical protein
MAEVRAAARSPREQIMTVEALNNWLVIGAVAAWLAGLIMAGGGFGLIGNIIN